MSANIVCPVLICTPTLFIFLLRSLALVQTLADGDKKVKQSGGRPLLDPLNKKNMKYFLILYDVLTKTK